MERGALEALLEMGFGPGPAAKALELTGNQGVEAAMDWLVAHEDEGGDLDPTPCGRGPREEEDETQRALSEAEQERERRRRGQELERLRQSHREQQQRRAAEERRREREEERLARQRVREKIERDKAERAKKFGSIPAASDPPSSSSSSSSSSAAAPPPPQRHYDHCKLQLRLPDGRALTHSFQPKEPLAAVRLFVELQLGGGGRQQDPPQDPLNPSGIQAGPGGDPGGIYSGPFELLNVFPRRRFTAEEMEKPLSELGLLPSAVLIVAKKQ